MEGLDKYCFIEAALNFTISMICNIKYLHETVTGWWGGQHF